MKRPILFDLDGTLISLEEYVKLFVDMQNGVFSKYIKKNSMEKIKLKDQ